MLVVTGTFEDERFIPDRPVSIPQKRKAVVIIEENPDAVVTKPARLTRAQIEEWSKTQEVQALVGALKEAGLATDISISDIRTERLAKKYKA